MSLTLRSHHKAEEQIDHQHQSQQTGQGFRKKRQENDNTQAKYWHEAAASNIQWRSLQVEGPPHDRIILYKWSII